MIPAEALAAVPGCAHGRPALELEPLRGGTANAAFRVRTDRGQFVVRLHDSASAEAGVDRAREVLLQQHAAAAGLAPRIVAADPQGRFWVSEFLSGKPWGAADMDDPLRLAQLARQLGRLHALAPPAAPALNLKTLLAAHAARIGAAGGPGDPHGPPLEPLIERAHGILDACARDGRRACMVHGDLYHANLIGTGPRLIDWEYAAVTDPLFDLACLVAYYPGAGDHETLLLAGSGLHGHVPPGRLAAAAWVYVLLSYLWYRALRLRAIPSAPDLEHEARLLERLSGAG